MKHGGWQGTRAKRPDSSHSGQLTFAHPNRLRLAGVCRKDRNALLGHGGYSMPEHYASADIGRVLLLAKRVLDRQGTRTLLRVAHG